MINLTQTKEKVNVITALKITEVNKLPKGHTNNPNGRPAGVPNKATMQAREAIAMFVDGNVHRLAKWLDDVAADNPAKAFELFQSVIEYHVPKLARTELTGKDGAAIEIDSRDVTQQVLSKLPKGELEKLIETTTDKDNG